MRKIDITEENLTICDEENLFFDRKTESIIAIYDHESNLNEFFGSGPNKDPVNWGISWNMQSDTISIFYWYDQEQTKYTMELSQSQQDFFRNITEKFSMKFYNCSIHEFYNKQSEDKMQLSHCSQNSIASENVQEREYISYITIYFTPLEQDHVDINLKPADQINREDTINQLNTIFRCNINVSKWFSEGKYSVCSDMIKSQFSVSIYGEDEDDINNFFEDCISYIKEDVKSLGYKISDISFDTKEI